MKQEIVKIGSWIESNNFTTIILMLTKKNYNSKDLNKKDKKTFDPSKFNKALVK